MNRTKRIITYLLIFIAVIIVLIAIGLFIIRTFHLDSKFVQGQIESILSAKLNRAVVINGDVNISYGLIPSLTISEAKMLNPKGWGHDPFISISKVEIQIELIPLLNKKIRIREVDLYGADINLESKKDGINNWDFDLDDEDKDEDKDNNSTDRILRSFSINNVKAQDVTLSYIDGNKKNSHLIKVTSLKGTARQDYPVTVELSGNYLKKPYSIQATSGTLYELIKSFKKFPINTTGTYLEADFDISGIVSIPEDFEGTDLSVNIQGKKLTELEDLLQENLPELKSYSISSDVLITEKSFELDNLELIYNETNAKGELNADFSDKKPNIYGCLDISNLDLTPFSEISQDTPDKDKDTSVKNKDHDLTPYFDFLNQIDADLELSIDQIINLPVDLTNITIKPQVRNGKLTTPFDFELEGVRIKGDIKFDTDKGMPRVQLETHSQKPDLTQLTSQTEKNKIKVKVESADLEFSALGKNITSFVESAKAYLEIKNVLLFRKQYTKTYSKDPIKIVVAKLSLEPGNKLVGSVQGNLLGHPTSINIISCKLTSLFSGNICPIKMTANTAGSRVTVSGDIIKQEEHIDSNLDIRLLINNISDFEDSVPSLSKANMPLMASANLLDTANKFSLRDINITLGRSNLKGEFSRELRNNDTIDTLILDSDLIDIPQLRTLLHSDGEDRNEDIERVIDFDLPVFPSNLPGIDSYIEIDLKRVILGKTEFQNMLLVSHINKGVMKDSEFSTQTGDTKFKGDVSIDISGAIPKAELHLYTSNVDVGEILESLGINEDIGFVSKELDIKIKLVGRTLKEIFYNSSFNAQVEDGIWTLRDLEDKENIEIDIEKGVLNTNPNKPISINVEGSYKDTPLNINATVKNLLSSLVSTSVKSPVTLNAEFSGTTINIDGLISYPLNQRNTDLSVSVSGENLQSLNNALDSTLPQIGPYELTGELKTTSKSLNFNNIKLRVGGSQVKGNINLVNLDHIPGLDVELYSDTIEIRDFIKSNEKEEKKEKEESFIDKINPISKPDAEDEKDTGIVFAPIIDALKLRTMDASIKMKINKLLINNKPIGDVGLNGTLHNGRLNINHFRINTPGGQINSSIRAQIIQDTIKVDFVSIVRDFDYSYLVESTKDDTDKKGIINLRLDLNTYGENIYEFDNHINGYARFNIIPKSFGTNIVDIWATNIIFSIMPNILRKSESKLNCIVGILDAKNGRITPKKMYIDTTNVRIRATGYLDFGSDRVNLVFKPLPKRPQHLFSLGIPITVTGTFENYRISTNVFKLSWFAVRIYYFTIDYLRRWLKKVPSDGSDICGKMDFETPTAR
ncbi:MAG: AsmA family protein [Thermodesulfobacteriota bacterium]